MPAKHGSCQIDLNEDVVEGPRPWILDLVSSRIGELYCLPAYFPDTHIQYHLNLIPVAAMNYACVPERVIDSHRFICIKGLQRKRYSCWI